MQKRFYYDSLSSKLILRGYLNGRDSGDPDLTSGPDPINFLEPNIITQEEFEEHGPEFENYDVYRNSQVNGPVVNGRVVHAFSGRTT